MKPDVAATLAAQRNGSILNVEDSDEISCLAWYTAQYLRGTILSS